MGQNLQAQMQAQAQQQAQQAGMNYAQEQLRLRYPWCQNVGLITTIVAMCTVLLVWAAAFGTIGVTSIGLAIYLFIVAIPFTMLEFSWLMNKCCNGQGFCCSLWQKLLWFDQWKRGVAYIAVSIPCFIMSFAFFSILGFIAAIALDVCGALYLLKTFQFVKEPLPEYTQVGGAGVPQQQPGGMRDPANFGGSANYGNTY